MIKVLQLCSYYPGTKLYKSLFEELDHNFNQTIYTPMKKNTYNNMKDNFFPSLKNGNYMNPPVWDRYHRIFYKNKIKKALLKLESLSKIDHNIIHAHTWFTDGGLAFEIYKKYHIPYIIVIRNTDLNIFYKFRIDLRQKAFQILKNASAIIFLSPQYKTQIINNIFYQYKDEFLDKSHVIPNGIDTFWLKSVNEKNKINKHIQFLFVGTLNKNKNIHKTINILLELKKNTELSLLIIGPKGDYYSNIEKLIEENGDWIKYIGPIIEKEDLLNNYKKSNIFIMPSKHETFGLVYIEAMSQGLPVIYNEGQGIDGYYEDGYIGVSINPQRIRNSINKIRSIIKNHSTISRNCIEESKYFSWKNIGSQYENIYKSIINE